MTVNIVHEIAKTVRAHAEEKDQQQALRYAMHCTRMSIEDIRRGAISFEDLDLIERLYAAKY